MSVDAPVGRRKPTPPNEHQTVALELLRVHRDMLDRERRTRHVVIRLARQYGLTNQRIADELGLSESAIRYTLNQVEGDG